jgi:hypothetical protein
MPSCRLVETKPPVFIQQALEGELGPVTPTGDGSQQRKHKTKKANRGCGRRKEELGAENLSFLKHHTLELVEY